MLFKELIRFNGLGPVWARRQPSKMGGPRGVLTLEGEVVSIAVKKLVLERAAAVPAVAAVIDRLHVVPAQKMGDRIASSLLLVSPQRLSQRLHPAPASKPLCATRLATCSATLAASAWPRVLSGRSASEVKELMPAAWAWRTTRSVFMACWGR